MKIKEKLDLLWLGLLGVLALAYCVVTRSPVFSSSIVLSGILCVALIAIGRKEGYLIGLYNSCAYAWVAKQNGLYGEVALNLLFFVPTGIIGFFMWKRHAVDHVVRMRSLSRQAKLVCFVGTFIAVIALGWILKKIPSQNTPYVDASTNVLSVIATFLMMWRFKEQWLLYMTLNVITIIMWVLRWQAEGEAGDLMVLMWALFLANSIFGYWRWSRGARLMAEGEAS